MGVLIKNNLEKLLKDAKDRAERGNTSDPFYSYGDRVEQEIIAALRNNKRYGNHIEGRIDGGSFIFTPFNMLSKKGRQFETTMASQGSDEYNNQFKEVRHKTREKEDFEREPDNPLFEGEYSGLRPEMIQDIPVEEVRSQFATNKGKNNVTIDVVFSGNLFEKGVDENGKEKMILSSQTIDSLEDSLIPTGQYKTAYDEKGNIIINPITNEPQREPVMMPDIDSFKYQYQQRLEEANKINEERLRALGYDLLPEEHPDYVKQRVEIANDPRFIETFPDLESLPKIIGNDGKEYVPEYRLEIHINGQKVDRQDLGLAMDQITRNGAYDKTALEKGREFMLQQVTRGMTWHLSSLPQQAIGDVFRTPGRLEKEAMQVATGTILQQLMQALSRGMSR